MDLTVLGLHSMLIATPSSLSQTSSIDLAA
jgi:hypothetical protein